MEFTLITLLNGISYGLLLFMLSSGLTLIFSMMGVLNFAHASFYMLGAYAACAIGSKLGFWPSLVLAPIAVGMLGALIERYSLRRLRKQGNVAELLFTFGFSYLILEVVQLIWGRAPLAATIPPELDGPLFRLYDTAFPIYRAFMMGMALAMMGAAHLLLTRTRIGLVIQAALTHADAVQALGHDVPRIFTQVFAGGCALAALAGVVGGHAFVIEPGMAATVGSVIFVVVVVGGMGSLSGALWASLLIGVLQTFAVAVDHSLSTVLAKAGFVPSDTGAADALMSITVAQLAPTLPYLLLVLVLVFRPAGLMGKRQA